MLISTSIAFMNVQILYVLVIVPVNSTRILSRKSQASFCFGLWPEILSWEFIIDFKSVLAWKIALMVAHVQIINVLVSKRLQLLTRGSTYPCRV